MSVTGQPDGDVIVPIGEDHRKSNPVKPMDVLFIVCLN